MRDRLYQYWFSEIKAFYAVQQIPKFKVSGRVGISVGASNLATFQVQGLQVGWGFTVSEENKYPGMYAQI